MSNYKWVKMSDNYTELRKEDFSSVHGFEVNEINPLIMKKLEENGIDYELEGDSFLEPCRYVLTTFDTKIVEITAPLYEFDLKIGDYVLISESYTDEENNPNEYELVKSIYFRCCQEVADEQAKVFEDLFNERTLDGISSVVTISSNPDRQPNYFYEQYIPTEYIKVCEKNIPFTRDKHDVVFIKKMDAKGQVVTIKIDDFYKGLVIGKGGENIKRISRMINARKIKVI